MPATTALNVLTAHRWLILNQWLSISSRLDRTFAALSDPTRRALIARLCESDSFSVSDLARPFSMSLPAVMKHLDVLSDAGLITRTKTGRIVGCRLKAAPMENAMNWLTRYQRFWSEQLDRLAAFVEKDSCASQAPGRQAKPHPQTSSPCAAGESLRRVDRAGKINALVRALATVAGSVRADMDVRVGGRFRVSFKTENGEHHEVGGVYREVVPNEKLVFSWAWHITPERESLVTVYMQADGDGTLFTLHHEQFFDQAARDGHESGWTGTMDKLELCRLISKEEAMATQWRTDISIGTS